MTDITMTILVLTIGITAIAFVANKMVQEIKKYHKLAAEMNAEEARRQEARERIKKMKMLEEKA